MLPEFIDFFMKFIIAGFTLRFIQLYAIPKDGALGKALAFIY
jgi:hypothetical protein